MSAGIEQLGNGPRHHVVQFYANDGELSGQVGRYLAEGLERGERALVVATPGHRAAFAAELTGLGWDPAELAEEGRWITLDAEEQLARFVTDDGVDSLAFDESVGAAVAELASAGLPLRVYGEMVGVLWAEGWVNAAIELESIWNDLADRVPFSLYCSYPSAGAETDDRAAAFQEVCCLHSAVVMRGSTVTGGADRVCQAATFPNDPRAVGHARRFVTAILEEARWSDLADDAALVTTELATNAVLHAGTPFLVTVTVAGDGVRIGVRDRDNRVPHDASLGVLSASGRGLALVSALAARVGTEPCRDGKVVWAILR